MYRSKVAPPPRLSLFLPERSSSLFLLSLSQTFNTWVADVVGTVALLTFDEADGRSLLTYLGFLTSTETKKENIIKYNLALIFFEKLLT